MYRYNYFDNWLSLVLLLHIFYYYRFKIEYKKKMVKTREQLILTYNILLLFSRLNSKFMMYSLHLK